MLQILNGILYEPIVWIIIGIAFVLGLAVSFFVLSRKEKPDSNLNKSYETRIESKIKEFHDKGSWRSLGYFWGQTLTIILGALISVLAVIPSGIIGANYQIIAAFLGGTISVIAGVLQLTRYMDAYRIYRTGEKLLEKEKILYENSVGPDYSIGDQQQKKANYVQNAEDIILHINEQRLARYDKGREEKIDSL